jgi:hypothetical protein
LVAHLTGGQGVAGSNPVSPTEKLQVKGSIRWFGLSLLIFPEAANLVPKGSLSSPGWPSFANREGSCPSTGRPPYWALPSSPWRGTDRPGTRRVRPAAAASQGRHHPAIRPAAVRRNDGVRQLRRDHRPASPARYRPFRPRAPAGLLTDVTATRLDGTAPGECGAMPVDRPAMLQITSPDLMTWRRLRSGRVR